MRVPCGGIILLMVIGCAGDESEPAPVGERFWWASAWDSSSEMLRRDDRIELRQDGVTQAFGTLTAEGLAEWDAAMASVDPAVVPELYQCGVIDGADICVEVEQPGADPLQVCYCADQPEPAVLEVDAYFTGLAEALAGCESTVHIVVDYESCTAL